jgi:1-acyl-sn-glycerol-3-phosphate acyltransferase
LARRAFLPPIINPLVVGFIRVIFPFGMRTLLGGLSVYISDDDLAKLRAYQGKRMLLLPNHPNGEEPFVLFEIFKRMNEVFNVVAAREVFDWEHGFRGWLLRRVGAYSVIRGTADRESFMMSKKILMEGQNRLVIFIEGEISRGNETLIPFEPGVLQLAFWAQEGLAKEAAKAARQQGDQDKPDYPPVYVAPLAIKYFYAPGSETAIETSLQVLEKAVGLPTEPGASQYARIRAIGEKVLAVQEALHQLVALPGVSLTERVEAIKNRMLKKMELFLGLKPDPQASTLSRLREIRNTMDHLIHTYDDPQELTDYEKRMVDHFRKALSEFYQDLDRVVYFLTYDEAYLQESQTPERFIDVIRRLEREVFGDARLTYPRVAAVKVGEVINLKEQFPSYESDKKGYVKHMVSELEENMRLMLTRMQRP